MIHDHRHESAWLQSRAGREFQILVLDRVAWLQWVTLGPKQITARASRKASFRKSIWKDARRWAFGIFDKLRDRPEPQEKRPDDPDQYESWLGKYLEQEWNPVYEEIGKTGTFAGYLSGYLSGAMQLPPDRVRDMSLSDFDAALRYQLGVGLDDPDELQAAMNAGGGNGGTVVPPLQSEDDPGFDRERAYAIAYAQREGVRWISMYDGGGKAGGRAYEVISGLYRKQLVEALENGESIEQLRSRFVFPDLLALLEKGEIGEIEYMTWVEPYLNRDVWRMATYEASAAWNNGRLQMLSEDAARTGNPRYVVFSRTAGHVL